MRILADENIAELHAHFDPLGDVRTFAARTLTPDAARDADVLLVRSTTRVDAGLLDGSAVRFVGSATGGYDHVDIDYLAARGIEFAYAPGCNADAVTDYFTAALLETAEASGWTLAEKTLAVVGVGHVGSRVAARGETLGLRVLRNDPPLAERGDDSRLRTIDEVLAGADIVSLHVPLTDAGRWPTRDMVGAAWLSRLKPGAIIVNTSRGDVVNEAALLAALRGGRIAAAVLDVWQNEPANNRTLAEAAFIATPHIAGYSRRARLNGTIMVRDALCRWLNLPVPAGQPSEPQVQVADSPQRATGPFSVRVDENRRNANIPALSDIRQVLDLQGLTQQLRRSLVDPAAPGFDALRRGQQDRGVFPVDSTPAGI